MTNNNFDIREWKMKQLLNELSDKQKKIASAAEPKDKITGDDFKALRAQKSVKEQPAEMIHNAEYLEEDDWMQKDDESDMAHGQLYAIKDLSSKLCGMIDDGEQLDAWVQAKLTKAEDYLNSVYRYLAGEEYEHEREEEEDEDEEEYDDYAMDPKGNVIFGAQFNERRGDTDYRRAKAAKRFGKKGEQNTFGAGVKKGEEIEKKRLRK